MLTYLSKLMSVTTFLKIITCFFFTDVNASYRELLEFAYLSLGFPFTSLTPNETSLFIRFIRGKLQGKPPDAKIQAFAAHMEQLNERFKEVVESAENFNLTHFLVENSVE